MQCARINITDDDCVEPDQIFTVSLSDLQNAPSSVTLGADISANVTILDDGECELNSHPLIIIELYNLNPDRHCFNRS